VLEKRAIGAGTVTTHGLREMIRTVMGDVLGEACVPEVLDFARNQDQALNVQPPVQGDRPILSANFGFQNNPLNFMAVLVLWQHVLK
jgi:hypothetical protein